ncbi:MAG: hypothetical protein HKN45_07895 [Flavobacteriales bacterium]|nr:hypothetical protein [Flavobacteriales bacterium]
MKALKIILFIIAVLILLFIILGFIGPKTYDVSRSIELDAPIEMVYEQVSDLSNMVDWDPWKEQMPDMKTTINGPGDEVGSYRRWESSESVGEEWLVELIPNKSVETELRFIEPFEMTSKGYHDLETTEDGKTSLSIGFKGENSFMGRAMSMLPGMNMDAQIGPMFEKGLQNISGILETKVAEQKASQEKLRNAEYAFGLQEMPERSFILKRATIALSDMKTFYASNLGNIYTAIGVSGREPAGQPCGIYYTWDEETGTSDMCAAIPVSDKNLKIEGFETVTLPSSRVVKVPYYGDYTGLSDVHLAIDDYIKANGLTQDGPVIEEYITDPETEPDPSKWLTNIYYMIK